MIILNKNNLINIYIFRTINLMNTILKLHNNKVKIEKNIKIKHVFPIK